MHTQRQLFDIACARGGALNYSQLADRLGMHRQAISACKYGLPISKHQALKLADLCALDPVYVMACIEHHRAERLEDTLTLPIWRAVADRFFSAAQQTGPAAKGLAVAMLAAFLMLANPVKSMAKPLIFNGHTIHYAKYNMRRIIKWLCDAVRITLAIGAIAALSGCAVLQQPAEIAWQAANVVDAVQTDRMVTHGACWEGDPITRAEIGSKPNDGQVAAWAIGGALLHAGVSELLDHTNHPTLEKIWQYVSLGDKAAVIVRSATMHGC